MGEMGLGLHRDLLSARGGEGLSLGTLPVLILTIAGNPATSYKN